MLDAFVVLSIAELLVVGKPFWSVRRPLAAGVAVGLALVSGVMVGDRPSLGMLLFAVISLYRVVSLLRVVMGRTEEHYLRVAIRRTTITLLAGQSLLLISLAISDQLNPSPGTWWLLLAIMQLGVSILLTISTHRQLLKTLPLSVSEHFSDAHLPALSVCVPARNETTALEKCLRSLVASDYPKLEILVLDDCSQEGRTSEIIKSFAHGGVRFVKGSPPSDGWLAKNWAYQQLYEASSGSMMLFCGVDVQFEPAALRNLVTTMLAKNKRMASVIPRNTLPRGFASQVGLLIQPARYAWEICPPRRLFNRPPVLSSCWVVERKLLEKSGSFAAVANTISPESYFARKAISRDSYSFIQSTSELAVLSTKSQAEQWETAVRTRYPQLRRRPEMVLAVSLLELLVLVAPFFVTIVGLWQGLWLQATAAGLAAILASLTYAQVVSLTYRKYLWRGIAYQPLAVLLDIYIRHESLWRYEFGDISWKGRNVCLPVMQVIPKFPKL